VNSGIYKASQLVAVYTKHHNLWRYIQSITTCGGINKVSQLVAVYTKHHNWWKL